MRPVSEGWPPPAGYATVASRTIAYVGGAGASAPAGVPGAPRSGPWSRWTSGTCPRSTRGAWGPARGGRRHRGRRRAGGVVPRGAAGRARARRGGAARARRAPPGAHRMCGASRSSRASAISARTRDEFARERRTRGESSSRGRMEKKKARFCFLSSSREMPRRTIPPMGALLWVHEPSRPPDTFGADISRFSACNNIPPARRSPLRADAPDARFARARDEMSYNGPPGWTPPPPPPYGANMANMPPQVRRGGAPRGSAERCTFSDRVVRPSHARNDRPPRDPTPRARPARPRARGADPRPRTFAPRERALTLRAPPSPPSFASGHVPPVLHGGVPVRRARDLPPGDAEHDVRAPRAVEPGGAVRGLRDDVPRHAAPHVRRAAAAAAAALSSSSSSTRSSSSSSRRILC